MSINIWGTILIVFLIIVIVFGLLVIIFTFFPFKYTFKVSYEDFTLDIDFNYFIFYFSFYLSVKDKIKYKAKIFNRVIADSENKKDKKTSSGSVDNTDFIQNEGIAEAAEVTDKEVKELFFKAKKRQLDTKLKAENEAEKENDESFSNTTDAEEKAVYSFIDKLNRFLPKDVIDVAKLITRETFTFLYYVAPKKYEIDMTVGNEDPFITGVALAFAAPLYAALGDDLKIDSSFDKSVFKAAIIATRRPQIIFMLIPISNLLLNKRFRDIVFKGKKEKIA